MIRLTDEDRLWERREGHKEGIIEGRREGEIEGLRKGEIKGRKEGKIEMQWNTAKNLLKENMPLDFIARVTGLSENEIATLLPQ